MAQHQPHCLQR